MCREKVDDRSFGTIYILLGEEKAGIKGISGGRRKTKRIHVIRAKCKDPKNVPSTSLSAAERSRRLRLLSLETGQSLIRIQVIPTVFKRWETRQKRQQA